MPLLFIIGTLGALIFIGFARRKRAQPQVLIRTKQGFVTLEESERMGREEYAKEQERWLEEHTDLFFGKPVGEGYNAPFPHKKEGYVFVEVADEFPSLDQRYIFEWMVERMNQITADGTALLQKSPDDWINQDEARNVFRAERISKIVLQRSEPVQWIIYFDMDIGEGEAFQARVSGKDQRVEDAALFM